MDKSRKHILILSSWYPNKLAPYLGNFVQRQAELLSKNFNVTVLYTVADPSLEKLFVAVDQKKLLKEIIVYHPKGKGLLGRLRQQHRAFLQGLSSIENVDIIHAHALLPKGYLFLRAKKYFNCPMVLTEHGSYFQHEQRRKLKLKERWILTFAASKIDQILAVSEVLKADMQAYFGKLKIDVLPNAIDTSFFTVDLAKKENSTVVFLHISTLDARVKNPRGMLDATALLKKRGIHNFKLRIASDESYDQLVSYAKSIEIESFIDFSGPHSPDELVKLYQSSDAFILFSTYETFSLVLAEAMSCGLPVITTPVGIAKELPSTYGILVKQNDVESLANAMESLLQQNNFNPKDIRSFAAQFSDDLILEKLTKIYQDLVD